MISGCTALHEARPGDPEYAPLPPSAMSKPKANDGSIYQDGYAMTLFETVKAKRIGDILTVMLQEKTNAVARVQSAANKKSSMDVDPTSVLGAQPFKTVGGKILSSNSAKSVVGDGQSMQNNNITGDISVTVVDILPNGNLVVRGEKWIMINQAKEFIRLKGIVRQEDVAPDNTIASTRIADARISYSGVGHLSDTSKVNWLERFFLSVIWPF